MLLSALDGTARVTFAAPRGWIAATLAGQELARGGSAATEALTLGSAGTIALGSFDTGTRDLLVTPIDDEPLRAGAFSYAGQLRVAERAGALRVVNRVPLERYVSSVVGSEMVASTTPAAGLQAQAIAARTYAYWSVLRRRRSPLPDTVDAQAYGGLAKETSATRAAARATAGRVLLVDGDFLPAFYHSTCGGRTIDGSWLLGSMAPPALQGVVCGACERGKLHRWEQVVPTTILTAAAKEWGTGGAVRHLEPAGPEDDPWSFVRVTGETGTKNVPARLFRLALHRAGQRPLLPSASLESIDGHKSGIRLVGRGFGHGVGLCQVGAAERAKRGESTERILAHYYPGASVGSPP